MSRKNRMPAVRAFAVVAALILLPVATAAAEAPRQAQYLDVGSGRYDLLRAHSDRTLVFFDGDAQFKKYNIIDMLHQYFTVASDIRGGVRHTVREEKGERVLVID